jgi:hypothetical protein
MYLVILGSILSTIPQVSLSAIPPIATSCVTAFRDSAVAWCTDLAPKNLATASLSSRSPDAFTFKTKNIVGSVLYVTIPSHQLQKNGEESTYRLQARITSVTKNGLLSISGQANFCHGDPTLFVRLSGVVHRSVLSRSNEVPIACVADLKVSSLTVTSELQSRR